MKYFNLNDIQKSFEPFKGVYELHDLIALCNDISFAPWEVCYLLPQCFTEENFDASIQILEKEWGKRFVDSLIVDVRRGSLRQVDQYLDSEWFSHVVENGVFDPHFLEGLEVLRIQFANDKWDSYLERKS